MDQETALYNHGMSIRAINTAKAHASLSGILQVIEQAITTYGPGVVQVIDDVLKLVGTTTPPAAA